MNEFIRSVGGEGLPYSTSFISYEASDSLNEMVREYIAPSAQAYARYVRPEFRSLTSTRVPLVPGGLPLEHPMTYAEQLAAYEQSLEAIDESEKISIASHITTSMRREYAWILFDLLPSEPVQQSLGRYALLREGEQERYLAGVCIPRADLTPFHEQVTAEAMGRLGMMHPARHGRSHTLPSPATEQLWVSHPRLRDRPPAPYML